MILPSKHFPQGRLSTVKDEFIAGIIQIFSKCVEQNVSKEKFVKSFTIYLYSIMFIIAIIPYQKILFKLRYSKNIKFSKILKFNKKSNC